MTAIIDYGVGNLFSLTSSLRAIGADSVVTADPETIHEADRLILPGVGAFGDASLKLRETGLGDTVKKEALGGKPLLGICLGMQLLFETGYEFGVHPGLGLLKGSVRPISEVIPEGLKIPHIGWNSLRFIKESPVTRYVSEGDYVYFVHSYHATECEESLAAVTEYGAELAAVVSLGSVFGCQFHPEKSGDVGLSILKAFVETKR
ncbi:MAG: imidazole glycerol phosphate synthase subunit HisH [Clostridia bacterium]|nr:imidazole glycerol phosphate synthase subunit HisH [Clostridia bacterium]